MRDVKFQGRSILLSLENSWPFFPKKKQENKLRGKANVDGVLFKNELIVEIAQKRGGGLSQHKGGKVENTKV